MPACAVYGCKNYSRKTKGSDIRYYSFPKDRNLRNRWIHSCCRQDKFNVDQARVCSAHFRSSAFMRTLKQQLLNYQPKTCRNLTKDAIPTEFLPDKKRSLDTITNERRRKREEIKNRKAIINTILERVTEELEVVPDKINDIKEDVVVEEALHSESSVSEMSNLIEKLKNENANIKKENEILQQNLASVGEELQSMKDILKQHFGPGQIKHMSNPGTPDDISSAIRSVSPKAYRYLHESGYPLPALSTLRRWTQEFNLDEGAIKDVL